MTKKELEKAFNDSDTWDAELLNILADMADMRKQWIAADGETFETVVYSMANKIGIKI